MKIAPAKRFTLPATTKHYIEDVFPKGVALEPTKNTEIPAAPE
jgi:putative NADPH-quinone reductase